MKETKTVIVEGVVVSTTEVGRNKVIFQDCEGEQAYALLTDDQVKLLDFLKEKGLLDYEAKWKILSDDEWEKV